MSADSHHQQTRSLGLQTVGRLQLYKRVAEAHQAGACELHCCLPDTAHAATCGCRTGAHCTRVQLTGQSYYCYLQTPSKPCSDRTTEGQDKQWQLEVVIPLFMRGYRCGSPPAPQLGRRVANKPLMHFSKTRYKVSPARRVP